MKQYFTSAILILLCVVSLIPQVSAKSYDVSLGFGFFHPIILPNSKLGLEINDTIFGYILYEASFQNGTRLEEFDSKGINTTFVVGNKNSSLDAYKLGITMIYTFKLNYYGLPPLKSTLEFHMFRNNTETIIPLMSLYFPDDIAEQIPCVNNEQIYCDEGFYLNKVTDTANFTFTGSIGIYPEDYFKNDKKESSSPISVILIIVVIFALVVLFIKFLSK